MGIWAELWPNPYADGKVHISVVRGILRNLDDNAGFGQIWTMVELSGIQDDLDKLATTRAIRTIVRFRRIQNKSLRPAICA